MIPPMTTVASGRWISAPGVTARAIGMNPNPATSAVMRMGRRRTMAASRAASWGSIPSIRKCSTALTHTSPFKTATPKSAMKPTPAEIENGMPRDVKGEDAAGSRHRHGGIDQDRQSDRVKRAVEQQEDQQHGHGHDDQQALGGRLQMLELAAPARVVEMRELDLRVDGGLGLGDEAGDIAAAHVHADDRPVLGILAFDLAGPFFLDDRRSSP